MYCCRLACRGPRLPSREALGPKLRQPGQASSRRQRKRRARIDSLAGAKVACIEVTWPDCEETCAPAPGMFRENVALLRSLERNNRVYLRNFNPKKGLRNNTPTRFSAPGLERKLRKSRPDIGKLEGQIQGSKESSSGTMLGCLLNHTVWDRRLPDV